MGDQAQGLRDLVKAGGFESMGLPKVFDQSPDLDWKQLWSDVKADLEQQSRGRTASVGEVNKTGAFVPTVESTEAYRMLSLMERAETFARVKADVAVKG